MALSTRTMAADAEDAESQVIRIEETVGGKSAAAVIQVPTANEVVAGCTVIQEASLKLPMVAVEDVHAVGFAQMLIIGGDGDATADWVHWFIGTTLGLGRPRNVLPIDVLQTLSEK